MLKTLFKGYSITVHDMRYKCDSFWTYFIINPYSTNFSTEHAVENYEFSTDFLQVSSEMQNDIVKISPGSKNARFFSIPRSTEGIPREYSLGRPEDDNRK